MDIGLDGGFSEPVRQAQSSFRAIMDALANPGTVQKFADPAPAHGPLSGELVSTLLTLSDQDTSIWVSETLRQTAGVEGFVAFHTGAPIVNETGHAVFAFAGAARELPSLDAFNLGTQEYPDRSTTIVLGVTAFAGGDEMVIRGPGIKDQRKISPVGLPTDFVAQWAANRELFPRGVDLLLVGDGAVMGLPRSTRIAEGH
ncbi:phosphonate C-P lyase system protein PhnH [Devosia ginsengisoli]|uniref:Phosphonate C-P lyase system protein PhnH n=1 Tax=Devosia ginsengisoli TaxID=400770 RepID=A0A5B8LQM5_9HYPH|nr:phosphonate C-P lyase system protein PhnH [Devosia ginsengisoli]QDZ09540.1 phosphonate C-P lyase system protein PhnH [Devosia ginsengisoli]